MEKRDLFSWISSHKPEFSEIAGKIWAHPELALKETYASGLQKEYLRNAGFRIHEVEGLPTAFVAEFGSGRPVIGLLGEYDALPGLSQQAVPFKAPVEGQTYGHGCGHNLLGTGCLAAAAAIKQLLSENSLSGTVRYYGCPAEEDFGGKIMMLDRGCFEGTDLCLTWHPESVNKIAGDMLTSVSNFHIRFMGETSYFATERLLCGNALHAAELLSVGVQYLNSQIQGKAKVEYFLSEGAKAVNLLPERTTVTFDVRGDDDDAVERVREAIFRVALGAAQMSGTRTEREEVFHYKTLRQDPLLADLLFDNMCSLGGAGFTEEELDFAAAAGESLESRFTLGTKEFYGITKEDMTGVMHQGAVKAPRVFFKPSSDVGNVSRQVPTAMFFAAAGPVGMPMHSWQAAALCGSAAGMRTMEYAAKVLAGTVYDLLSEPELYRACEAGFRKETHDEPEC